MYFLDLIKSLINNKDTHIFVDMDGVIAAYEVGKPYNYDEKRALTNRINLLKEISQKDNVTMHILSACKLDIQIKEKNDWLDINAPFFKKENRVIISKENLIEKKTANLKTEYLKSVNDKYENIIVIEDDNQVIKTMTKELQNIAVIQDSELDD